MESADACLWFGVWGRQAPADLVGQKPPHALCLYHDSIQTLAFSKSFSLLLCPA